MHPAISTSAQTLVNAKGPPARLAFIDNIRWTIIILVLSMHASDTYSPFGNWYLTDRRPMSFAATMTFAVYQSFLQAFFMALLFFLSGYFAAPALDRKGVSRFVRDRFVRLGLPTLLYMLVIGPLTQYYLSHSWGGGGFAHQWWTHLADGEWLSETGPMWFCAALLIFSLVYALLERPPHGPRRGIPFGSIGAVFGFVAVMASATFAVRVVVAENVSLGNMHFGDFPQYVLMFAVGILAYRGHWLDRVSNRSATHLACGTLLASTALLVCLILLGGALRGDTKDYSGGFNPVSAGKSLWESLVCVGMSFGSLALYRRYFDHQGAAAKFLSNNAFAVYLFHPPVIVGLALLFRGFEAPALARAATLTAAAAVVTFALCALVFRRIPLLQQIL